MSPRILVVDDDPGMVRTLCDLLRLRGWESLGVHSGEAAVAAQCEGEYAVVLMDIMMPGMDGVSALREMKICRSTARVILMTAHTAPDKIAEAMSAGAVQVISKPIDLRSLMRLLESAGGSPPAAVH